MRSLPDIQRLARDTTKEDEVGKHMAEGLLRIRKQLELEQRARAHAMKARVGRASVAGAPAGDEGDQAAISLQQRLEGAEFLRLSSSLRSVEAALKTLEAGRYGVCQHCEEPIPRRRLLALPTAILCRECQEAAEEVRAACRACAPDRQPAVSAVARHPASSGCASRKEHGRLMPS